MDTEAEIKPIIHDDGITYAYISHNNLYLLAVSRANVNAMATLYFLHRLVDVFKFYFEARTPSRARLAARVCACRRARRRAAPGFAPPNADCASLLIGAGRGVAARQLRHWCARALATLASPCPLG